MFETAVKANAKLRIWSTAMGMVGQAAALALAVLTPMVAPDTLPRVQGLITNVFTFVPAPDPPPQPAEELAPAAATVPLQSVRNMVFQPTAIPDKAVMIVDPPDLRGRSDIAAIALGGGNAAAALPELWNEVARIPAIAPPPERPGAVLQVAPKRIRTGGLVKEAVLMQRVEPEYPELARRARVAGIVELEGIIGTDGRMRELRVVSGNPLLVGAALKAVQKWVYRPTLLNGEPVEVEAPIRITFTLR